MGLRTKAFITAATKSFVEKKQHAKCVEKCVCGLLLSPFSDFFGTDGLISLLILGNLKVEFVVYNAKNQGTYYQPSF